MEGQFKGINLLSWSCRKSKPIKSHSTCFGEKFLVLAIMNLYANMLLFKLLCMMKR